MTGVDANMVVDWLVSVGYPYDWSAPDNPLPEALRRPLAEAWMRHEGCTDLTVDEYMHFLAVEGAW